MIKCDVCSKSFKNARGLNMHRIRAGHNPTEVSTVKIDHTTTLAEAIAALKLKMDHFNDVIEILEQM